MGKLAFLTGRKAIIAIATLAVLAAESWFGWSWPLETVVGVVATAASLITGIAIEDAGAKAGASNGGAK